MPDGDLRGVKTGNKQSETFLNLASFHLPTQSWYGVPRASRQYRAVHVLCNTTILWNSAARRVTQTNLCCEG